MSDFKLTVFDLMRGRKIMVPTDMGVDVELTIEKVTQDNHSQDIGPSTRENDWWPEQRTWTTFTVKFTNGKSKQYSSLNEIKFY